MLNNTLCVCFKYIKLSVNKSYDLIANKSNAVKINYAFVTFIKVYKY